MVTIKNNALHFIPSEIRNCFINDLQLINGDVRIDTAGFNVVEFNGNDKFTFLHYDSIKQYPIEAFETIREALEEDIKAN